MCPASSGADSRWGGFARQCGALALRPPAVAAPSGSFDRSLAPSRFPCGINQLHGRRGGPSHLHGTPPARRRSRCVVELDVLPVALGIPILRGEAIGEQVAVGVVGRCDNQGSKRLKVPALLPLSFSAAPATRPATSPTRISPARTPSTRHEMSKSVFVPLTACPVKRNRSRAPAA